MSDKAGPSQVLTQSAQEKLAQFVQRIERLEEEKANTAGDIKEVYAEAKGLGYDTKALRAIIRDRKKDAEERETEREMVDLYAGALAKLDSIVASI